MLKHLVKSLEEAVVPRQLQLALRARLYRNNLQKLCFMHQSDKFGRHFYTDHYQRHFWDRRHLPLKVLEIGVGGYDDPKAGGASLRMWRDFFPNARIAGIDIHDKSGVADNRIQIFQGDQTHEDFLKKTVATLGGIDIVIDDGSHFNSHMIQTFEILYPLLSKDGIYVVEDTQTSYWDNFFGVDWGGDPDRNATHTPIAYFKKLFDGLNFEEFLDPDYSPTYFDRHIIAMHFYHNLVFIMKGENNEGGAPQRQ